MEVVLDCTLFLDKISAHHYLKQTLGFPNYYGGNLDALYDCLMELSSCRLLLQNSHAVQQLGSYGENLLSTIRDAAEHNPGLELVIL